MTYDWLICGGGIHGVHIAARLIGEVGTATERVAIVDPGETLLSRWRACTQATGMSHLRSSSVHHLDLEPMALQRFAKQVRRKLLRPFHPPYQRPSLPLFDAHCDRLINAYHLDSLHIRDRVSQCRTHPTGLELSTQDGRTLHTKRLVLAIGSGDRPIWPEGAPPHHPSIQHIFDPSFQWPSLTSTEPVLVIGGGISAGQVALRLVREGHCVHLVSRHALREHQFDSDPGWLGPKYLKGFGRERCPVRRRKAISAARHRGSMPADVRRPLLRLAGLGQLYLHQAEIQEWSVADDQVSLKLSEEVTVRGQQVLLATGFEGVRPGGAWIEQLISELDLPIAPCGFPIVDRALRWHPRVFVSGALAELEVGPVARNIAGARMAGNRIMEFLRSEYDDLAS